MMNNFKKSIFAIILLTLFGTLSYAAEQISGTQITSQPEIDTGAVAELNLTSARFCNNGLEPTKLLRNLFIDARPGTLQNICALFINKQDTGINLYVGFTEATLTENNTFVCEKENFNNKFADLIREDIATTKLYIKPHMQAYKNFNMAIPKSGTGKINGCMVYRIDSSSSHKTWAMFGILIRKTVYIGITVTGDVYNFWWRDDIKLWFSINRQPILKVVAGILILWLLVSIIQTVKRKEKKPHHKKK